MVDSVVVVGSVVVVVVATVVVVVAVVVVGDVEVLSTRTEQFLGGRNFQIFFKLKKICFRINCFKIWTFL